ncbi:hypothetical protein GRF29_213g1312718 [Pseudopithomyces chartarum]|uniref:Killer toxin Kp4 domain-containing protein n=1 Tax=Pseudopithomyces chartarum TaxID=1892770 RepID=A0AAN6LMP8_9PLEO|nr:hypothetical protein GRF29_213g1312718 [Pseudopithomyces chartarum]
MHFSTPIIGAILAFGAQVSAKGINCEGSSNCGLITANLQQIVDKAQNVGDYYVFKNGEHIACIQGGGTAQGSLCAFLQGTAGVEGWKVKQLLGFIKDHGCKKCGSVPRDYPNHNDINYSGQLTVNWVQ